MAEEEAKKEKADAEEAKRVVDELNKAIEVARLAKNEAKKTAKETKKVLLVLEESKKDLEARVDYAEARAKMAEDLLAKEHAGMEKKLVDREDKLVDSAMYRIWSMNADLDLSFLEGEQESTLARWKARLEKEELFTFTEAAARDDDGGEISSKAEVTNADAPVEADPTLTAPAEANKEAIPSSDP